MENKMSEVAKLLGVELDEEFKIYGWDGFYKITELGLGRYVKGRTWMMVPVMLIDLIKGTAKIIKIPKAILTDKEKDYLSAVIKPFRDRIISIRKYRFNQDEYIGMYIKYYAETDENEMITLPVFKEGTMYNGLETNREYTLDELGL